MKKISKNNLPQKEVIAYNEDGYCMVGIISPIEHDMPVCRNILERTRLHGIVAYETISETKKRVQAVLTVKTK